MSRSMPAAASSNAGAVAANAMPKFSVPDELREVLLEFTVNYLLEQPGDIFDYAAEFFAKLRDNRRDLITQENRRPPQSPDSSAGSGDEYEPPPMPSFRRKSVFAETYNPEDDDDDEGQKVIHPKSDDQRKRLAASVRNILLFRSLEPEQMNEVLDAMFERRVLPHEYVIKQGDDGDNFYVIESGQYSVYVKPDSEPEPRKVGRYDNSGSFGELALMYNMPRAASVQAESEGLLWAMDRLTFRRIVLKSAFRKRKMYEALIEGVPMLKALQLYERMNLADALVPRYFKDGSVIIRQGDVGDGMYFVEDGTVRIAMVDKNGVEAEISPVMPSNPEVASASATTESPFQLNRVGKGGYFGEMALITHRPRAASVYAVGDVKLAFLDVDAFERLLGPCMDIMKRHFDNYEEQIRRIFGVTIHFSEMR